MRKQLFSYTSILIAINVLAFLFTIIFNYYSGGDFIKHLAIQPKAILEGKDLWTFLTSMFLHASISHLLANMISLVFIGGFVERLIGKKRFIKLYFIGGLLAGLIFVLLAGFYGNTAFGEKLFGSPLSYAVGASGAIFALGGLLAVLTPKLRVYVFFVIPMPIWVAMIGLTFVMWSISLAVPLGIGNTAHFGGLLVGIVYGIYLRKKYPKKTQMISRYFAQ